MFAILRAWALAFVILSVLYLALRSYFRSTHRERLENRFDAGQGDAGLTRDAYIERGMAHYDRGLRLKLLWLVYILPMAAIAATIYWVNYD